MKHPLRNTFIVAIIFLLIIAFLFWWSSTHTEPSPKVGTTGPSFSFQPLYQGTPQNIPTPPTPTGVPNVPDTTPSQPTTAPKTNPSTPAPTQSPSAPTIVTATPAVIAPADSGSSFTPPKTTTVQSTGQTSSEPTFSNNYGYGYSDTSGGSGTSGGTAPDTTHQNSNSSDNTLKNIMDYLQIFGTLTGNPIDITKTSVDLTSGLFSGNPIGGTNGMLFGGGGGGGGGGGFGGGGFGGGGGGGALQSFGTTKITRITECTCSGSRLLDMQDTNNQMLSLLVTPGTQVKSEAYSMYGIHTGSQALGTYTAGGVCEVIHGEECDSEGQPRGSIVQMGTSK